MKPLFRWIIGDVHPCGFDVLRESIRIIKNIYDFDILVCCNSLSDQQMMFLRKLKIEIFIQKTSDFPLSNKPFGTFWKLCPPRLRPGGYEIIVDNDIIITKKLSEIDHFLESNHVLMYQGIFGSYGSYEGSVSKGFFLNSGVYGFPPGYDFSKKIKENSNNTNISKFDEQGIIVKTLSKETHSIIPLTKLPIIEPTWEIEFALHNVNLCGFHFVGANRTSHPQFYRTFMQKYCDLAL